jgi:hypothetical protein
VRDAATTHPFFIPVERNARPTSKKLEDMTRETPYEETCRDTWNDLRSKRTRAGGWPEAGGQASYGIPLRLASCEPGLRVLLVEVGEAQRASWERSIPIGWLPADGRSSGAIETVRTKQSHTTTASRMNTSRNVTATSRAATVFRVNHRPVKPELVLITGL